MLLINLRGRGCQQKDVVVIVPLQLAPCLSVLPICVGLSHSGCRGLERTKRLPRYCAPKIMEHEERILLEPEQHSFSA